MPVSNNPTPGTPPLASLAKGGLAITHPPTSGYPLVSGTLYTLDYLRGNQKISKIFRFPPQLTIGEVVEHCKKYCGDNNFRFIWAEITINVMAQFEE